MSSNKSNKIRWLFDNKLDLSRNKIDIDPQFSLFKTKNSPMYNEAISPLYTETKEFENRIVYDTNGNRFHYENGILYMNDEEVMKTGGDSYFTREEVERDEYDSYDIDENGNTLWSKYDHGLITYHTPNGDYTYSLTDNQSAILDCRARIVNNHPVIIYLFVNTAGSYDVVFLYNDIQYIRNILHWNQRRYYLNNVLTSSNTSQNRATANSIITDTLYTDINDYVKLNSPLIQIANPVDDVICISIVSDYGGKLKPEDVGYICLVYNNGKFFTSFDWNRSTSEVDIDSHSTVTVNYKTELEHKTEQISVYQYYDDPNAPADFKAIAKANLGKFYLSSAADPTNPNMTILVDEVELDPGYTPTNGQAVTDQYQVGSGTELKYVTYTKWLQYQVESYTDSWTMKTTVNPFEGDAKNATLDISYTVTPKKKIIEKENSETQDIILKTEDIINKVNEAGKEFGIFEYLTNYVDGLTIDDVDGNPVLLDESWKYSNSTNRLACVKLTPHNESNLAIYYDVEVLFRAVGENKPTYFKYSISQEEWTGPNDIKGLKEGHVASDFKYLKFSTCKTIPATSQTSNDAVNIDYKQLVNFVNGTTETRTNIIYDESQEWNAELGRNTYFYWIDDEPITYTKSVKQSSTAQEIEFNYKYILNNTDYQPAYLAPNVPQLIPNLFEGFSSPMTIKFKSDTLGQGKYAGSIEEEYTTPYDINYLNTDSYFIKQFDWSYKSTRTQNVLPNIILDDGTAVALFTMQQYSVLPINALIVTHAEIVAANDNIFDYKIIGSFASGPVNSPGCVWDISVDLNINYYRILFNLANNLGSTGDIKNAAIIIKPMYDSGARTTILEPGATTPDTTENSENNSHYYNLQGSISKLYNKWRNTINSNGLITGISYGEDQYIGSLLCDWFSLADNKYIYYNSNKIGYNSSDGRWYEIEIKQGDGDINILFDRYIIVNTNGYWNCYDIERKRQTHYASDFNNRVIAGCSVKDFGENGVLSFVTSDFKQSKLKYSTTITNYFVSGINSMYEVSQDSITSLQISPQPYTDIIAGYETFIWCKQPDDYTPQFIEIFYGESSDNTKAEYQYSQINYDKTIIKKKDSSLIGLAAPVAIGATMQVSPNMFTEFIHTYNNKDLVVNGHFGYPIIYSETTPILSYTTTKQISNVDNIFVIQSQFYGIINDKIVSITYDNYSIIAIDAIIDIKGMIYLGYLPTMAFFFSPSDRCIYTFTGDANLDINMEASNISEVYNIYYNTATESIFVTTDIGVLVISGKQMWMLDVLNVDNIYFIKKGYFIITHKEGDKYISTAYSYERDLLESPVKQKVLLESKYCGPGDGKTANTDNIQVILISDYAEAGEIKFSSSTFTDTGFKSESKTMKISKDLWNNGEQAIVCNFFPKYQTGQGFKWFIESDFPIAQIIQSVTPQQSVTLTQHNI